jgi:hypothetical protein
MARLARVILSGYPHHITQRGNRRQDVFFKESDDLYYIGLLKECCHQQSVEVWSYCLMTNYAHLSGIDENGLVEVNKVQELFTDWKNYLLNAQGLPMEEIEAHNRTGRPLGNNRFIKMAEKITGRDFVKKKPGPISKEIK